MAEARVLAEQFRQEYNSRLVRGETAPSYALAEVVTTTLSRKLSVELSMRDVFSTDGTYPTPCVCDLTTYCNGCFPPEAYHEDDTLKPAYRDLRPGDWCRFPPRPPFGAERN